MNSEEAQLYTDLIKVGFPVAGTLLGGIIGALSTYFITRLNNQNENGKEALKKRQELVLEAATDITEFEHLIGTYVTAVHNQILNLDGTIDMVHAKHNLLNNNHALRRARMTIKVLGLKDAELKLEEYIEATREVIAKGTNLTRDRVSELKNVITKGPVYFYECLSLELSSTTTSRH